ncbi:acyltransferase family protein [Pseudomonas sp. 39167]|uniref:acyltransferase family protein n=1 Tax=Pseudomonas sp. 39167 TaxID=2967215 RepID=UPI0023644BCD|nr:acyltransferase [Pseudomonas sp. 39167]MDD2031066.1 acyltransferase [Pseudomonas sp. 39167]
MTEKFSGADGIRGLACLIVLCAHVPGFFVPEIAKYFSGTGKFGVWLFFVLSAFLLTSKFSKNGFSIPELSGYAIGRTLRIIPLFMLVTLIYWNFNSAGILTGGDVLSANTFKQGYAHLWTIPVEFKYYFFLPAMAYSFIMIERRHGHFSTIILATMIIFFHQLAWPYWNTPENSISTYWYIPSFVLGSYAAVSINTLRQYITPLTSTLIASLVTLSLLFMSPGGRNILLGMPFDGWLMNKFIFLSFLWMLFVVFLADGKGVVGRLMQTTLLKTLGAWSYSIYLIHWLFYQKLSLVQHGWIYAFFAMLGSIGAGAFLYLVIEAPIEKFRHSLQKKINPKLLQAA